MTTSLTHNDMLLHASNDTDNWLRGLESHTIYWPKAEPHDPMEHPKVVAERRNDSIAVALAGRPGEWAVVDRGTAYNAVRGLRTPMSEALKRRGFEVEVRRTTEDTLTTWARWNGE